MADVYSASRAYGPVKARSGFGHGARGIARPAHRVEDPPGGTEAPLAALAWAFGPLAIRLGLGTMLALAALGWLPRRGVPPWAEPTLFVPDMPLAPAEGWALLEPVQLAVAAFLILGVAVRLAGLAVVALAAAGLSAFGLDFVAVAAQFAGPGLMLAICGGGAISVDRALGFDGWMQPGARTAALGWAAALALLGLGFAHPVALGVTGPVLAAVPPSGAAPLPFALSSAGAALVAAGAALLPSALLAGGRLVRPLALILIAGLAASAAISGDTPLAHAHLYGALVMLALAGPRPPLSHRYASLKSLNAK